MRQLRKNLCSILIPLLGWLLARVGLAVVAVDELAGLRARPEPRETPPGTKLVPCSFIGVDPQVMAAVGADAAVLYGYITGWLARNRQRGRDYTYNSYPAWAALIAKDLGVLWSQHQIGRMIRALKAAAYLDGSQPAPHRPTEYREGAAGKARRAELHGGNAVTQLPLDGLYVPSAKTHDIQSDQSSQSISHQSDSTPAASSRGRGDGAAAAPMIVQPISEILGNREASDRAQITQPDGDGIRHARRPAPPPVPAPPSPRQPELPTTEVDPDAQESEPVSAAISGVFAPPVARVLVAQYGANVVEALIADTRSRQGVTNLAGLVRTRLAQGDRVEIKKSYDDMTQEQKLRKWLGDAYNPAVHA